MHGVFWVGVIALCACSKVADKDPAAKDPWATTNSATPTSDPWATANSAAPTSPPDPTPDPTPPPTAPAEQSSMAGLYRCETFTFLVSGSKYLPSGIGKIVIDADGTYHVETTNDIGHVRERDNTMHFEGGTFDGWVTAIRPNSNGRYFIVNSRDAKTPVQEVHLGDTAC